MSASDLHLLRNIVSIVCNLSMTITINAIWNSLLIFIVGIENRSGIYSESHTISMAWHFLRLFLIFDDFRFVLFHVDLFLQLFAFLLRFWREHKTCNATQFKLLTSMLVICRFDRKLTHSSNRGGEREWKKRIKYYDSYMVFDFIIFINLLNQMRWIKYLEYSIPKPIKIFERNRMVIKQVLELEFFPKTESM